MNFLQKLGLDSFLKEHDLDKTLAFIRNFPMSGAFPKPSSSPSDRRKSMNDVLVHHPFRPVVRHATKEGHENVLQVLPLISFGTSNKSMFHNSDLQSSQRTPTFPMGINLESIEQCDSHLESDFFAETCLLEENEPEWVSVSLKMLEINSRAVYRPAYRHHQKKKTF